MGAQDQEQYQDQLADAAARGMPVTVGFFRDGSMVSHRSRFLRADPQGIWIEDVPSERELVAAMMASAQPAAVSFRMETLELRFTSPVLQIDPALSLNDGNTISALLLAAPTEITALQRRCSYRVRIVDDDAVTIKLWRIGDKAILRDKPTVSAQIKATLRDLSVGGAGILLAPLSQNSVKLITGQRLRIVLAFPEQEELLLEGRLRCESTGPVGPSIPTPAGIQFSKLDQDLASRQTATNLTRLVGELQRKELRRLRLAVA
jgi:c-di-GMP-binding flagellar brake protein YcgR